MTPFFFDACLLAAMHGEWEYNENELESTWEGSCAECKSIPILKQD